MKNELPTDDDAITLEAMTPHWRGRLFGGAGYRYYAQLESTNATAMNLGRQGCPEGTLVATDCQTRGRGRMNRLWVAPPGKNLSFSLILRPTMPLAVVQRYTLLAGLALAEAMTALGITGHALKWPNDLYLGGRKVAGILAEASTLGDKVSFLVVGVGINVNPGVEAFPLELQSKVTSLASHVGHTVSRGQLLGGFLAHFERWSEQLIQSGFAPVRKAWLGYWQGKDKKVTLVREGKEVTGIAVDLDQDGRLLILLPSGELLPVASGEVLTMEGEFSHAAGG